jgi:hypothetical protein
MRGEHPTQDDMPDTCLLFLIPCRSRIDRMGKRGIIDNLRYFERTCLEQAELCVLEDSRRSLRSLAGDGRIEGRK